MVGRNGWSGRRVDDRRNNWLERSGWLGEVVGWSGVDVGNSGWLGRRVDGWEEWKARYESGWLMVGKSE